MQPVGNPSGTKYRFESFELDPVRRTLSRGGEAIALKPKVFETLLVLVQNSGRVTADGRLIVFQSNRIGSNEIWRANVDGSDLRRLTSGGGNSSPHPTPDGKWVVYTSTHDASTIVWRVPIDGGNPVRVTDREFSSPRVSPDGRFIACGYRADANSRGQLALIKIESGAAERLFDVAQTAKFEDGIRWTPDGKAVCYKDAAHGIWRQDINGAPPQLLPGLPDEPMFPYGWSRDGKFFALTRGRIISDAVLIKHAR